MARIVTSSNLQQSFDDQDRLVEETDLVDGVPHGVSKMWSSAGILIGKAQFQRGKLHGEALTWNVAGQLVSKANYENGELQGRYQSWWDNGQLKEEGFYNCGLRAETYVWHDEDGKVIQRKSI